MNYERTASDQPSPWEPEAPVKRSGFQALDAALHSLQTGKVGCVYGTYTGDGAAQRVITLGFRPAAVLLSRSNGEMFRYPTVSGGLAFPDLPLMADEPAQAMTVTEQGFRVASASGPGACTNVSGRLYYYLAIQ